MSETKQAPTIVDTKFRNPDFWERNVVYFANLKSLFFGNAEQTSELARQVGEIDSYGGRLLPVLDLIYRGGHNALVLEKAPEASLSDYFSSVLQLSLPRVHLLSQEAYQSPQDRQERIGQMLESADVWFDGYVTDETLLDWAKAADAKTVSTLHGSREGNNKAKLYAFLKESDLPTPETLLASSVAETRQALGALKRHGYRSAAVRSAIGASGIGMMKAELRSVEELDIPKMLFHEGACLVQGWLEPGVDEVERVTSPSVQLFLDERAVNLFDITDQILSSESIHEGNHSPPSVLDAPLREELLRQAARAGEWLHRQGYRGTASADFLVVHRSDHSRPTVYVCEVNARITGATYPSVLARHLMPQGAWLMRNLRLESPIAGDRLLELVGCVGRLFEIGDTHGVVPLNFNYGPDGDTSKGQFLCLAPTVEECRDVLEQLVGELPFKTRLERD